VDLAAHPALLGEREVTRATVNKDAAGSPLVALQLTQPAAQVLFTWTASHSGETLGIVMDGVLVTVVMVAVPIEGGLLGVGGLDPGAAAQFAAVVNGGPLSFAILELSAVAPSPAP
jgi:preprotein translocase subunit SecD